MTRRLLVVDRYDAIAFDRTSANGPDDTWDVLLLGLSHEWFQWRCADRLRGLTGWRLIDPTEFASAALGDVTAFVGDYMPSLPNLDLGGATLFQLLDGPEGSEWWFIETCERGPYRGRLIGQLYGLALLRRVLERGAYDEVWHSLGERALAEVLSQPAAGRGQWVAMPGEPPVAEPRLANWPLFAYWARAVRAAVTMLALKALCRWLRLTPVEAGAELTFTMFPAWWSDPWGRAPRELFFSQRDTGRPQGFLSWLTDPVQCWRNRAALARLCRTRAFIPLQAFLGVRDLPAVLSPARFKRFLDIRRRLRQSVRAPFAGFDVGVLIERDVARSMATAERFQDVLVARAARRAARAVRPEGVLYRAEFQPIEHALLRGLDGSGAWRVGFVHFPFGERYLSMRFPPAELTALHDARCGHEARPMPDGIIAIGPASARHVAAAGYPEDRVAVCGPQRYGHLAAYRRTRPTRDVLRQRLRFPPDRFVIVVAIAMITSDTQALAAALVKLSEAFEDALLIVRTHPYERRANLTIDTLLSVVGTHRVRFMPAAGSLHDVIAASDLMICIGSMIAFEAMALDVMPVVFESAATFAATSLSDFEAGLFVVRTGSELVGAIREIRGNSPRARDKRDAWPAMLRDVFGDLDRPIGEQMDEALGAIVRASTGGGTRVRYLDT